LHIAPQAYATRAQKLNTENGLQPHRSRKKLSLHSPFIELLVPQNSEKNPRFTPFFFATSQSCSALPASLKDEPQSPRFSKTQSTTFLPSRRQYIVFCTNEFE
jgi:hypothetical protein